MLESSDHSRRKGFFYFYDFYIKVANITSFCGETKHIF